MQLSGEQKIHAPRKTVWEGLNDPEVLRRSIPGCVSLERLADDRMQAVVEIKIGPIGARFNGMVTLSDQIPPESYTISGEGQGGTVGNAKGGAKVRLIEEAGSTLLSYQVDAQVGGRLAQLGGPIIDATAKQLAAKFFREFGEIVGQPARETASANAGRPDSTTSPVAAPAHDAASLAPSSSTSTPLSSGGFPAAWMLGLLAAALIGFLFGRAQAPAGAAEWIGLSVGLLVVIMAAAGFEFGRRTSAPVVLLDAGMLRRLMQEENK